MVGTVHAPPRRGCGGGSELYLYFCWSLKDLFNVYVYIVCYNINSIRICRRMSTGSRKKEKEKGIDGYPCYMNPKVKAPHAPQGRCAMS